MKLETYKKLSWEKILAKMPESGRWAYVTALRGPDIDDSFGYTKDVFTGFVRGNFGHGSSIRSCFITLMHNEPSKIVKTMLGSEIPNHFRSHIMQALDGIGMAFEGEVSEFAKALRELIVHIDYGDRSAALDSVKKLRQILRDQGHAQPWQV